MLKENIREIPDGVKQFQDISPSDPLPRPDRGNLCLCRVAGLGGPRGGSFRIYHLEDLTGRNLYSARNL